MTTPLETIVALQDVLRQLQAAETRLNGIPDSMRELHEQHQARKNEIDALETALAEAGKDRRTAEGALSDMQEKQKHYQQQLSLVRTQREYGALLQEIDTAKSSIKGLEEQALQGLDRESKAEAALVEQRAAFADLDARYAAELAQWEATKPGIVAEVTALKARAKDLEQHVPPALLTRFMRLLTRNKGEALAPVLMPDRGGRGPAIYCCGSCNYRVRPQVLVELRNQGSILECDSCRRILFLPEGV